MAGQRRLWGLSGGQSVTGRVKNSDVTRQSEMGVRVKPEAFANAPAVEYYHAQTGWRIDERDILQMSLPERAKFVVREGVAAQAGTSGDFGTPVAAAMLRLAVLTSRISRSWQVGCRREKLRMSFRKCSGAERVAHSRSAAGPREPCGGAVGQARVSQHRGTLAGER